MKPAAPPGLSFGSSRSPAETSELKRELAPLGIRFSKVPREYALHAMVLCMGVALCLRLFSLQIFSGQTLAERALHQQTSEETIISRPGDVLDRHGRLLATTVAVPSLYVNPKAVSDRSLLALQLGAALQISAEELLTRLEQNREKQFMWVKRRLSENESTAVLALGLPSHVAGMRREFQRVYPQGHLAAHVLGLRNIDGQGRGGVEEYFDAELRGEDGVRRFVRDARGFVLDVMEEVTHPPVNGTTIVLTIDTLLQLAAERQLDDLMQKHQALSACAIAMDPRNGEILALASRPTFDSNHPEHAAADSWKNMATVSAFEPGSTFKPLVVAWALDHGHITRDESFNCEMGQYRMGNRVLHDHRPHGTLSLTDVLVKSSNIGMAKIGQRLGNHELYRLATLFGFGQRTGIELPGEQAGLLRPEREWTSYSTGSIPMGHELSATPLQMLAAYSVLANHGERINPHLLLRGNGEKQPPRQVVTSRIVSADHSDWLINGPLTQVVERGTARQAHLPGIHVFGKTGTAQKALTDEAGYSSSRHLSSFVGGATAEDPHLIVLISVDEPHGTDQFGGSVAAPYVANILKAGLSLTASPAAP